MELRHGQPDGPSLVGAISASRESAADEPRVVAFLQNATTLAATTAKIVDFADSPRGEICTASIRTDGHCVWPEDLAYYLETYHIELPAQMIERMRQNNFKVPIVTTQRLSQPASRMLDG